MRCRSVGRNLDDSVDFAGDTELEWHRAWRRSLEYSSGALAVPPQKSIYPSRLVCAGFETDRITKPFVTTFVCDHRGDAWDDHCGRRDRISSDASAKGSVMGGAWTGSADTPRMRCACRIRSPTMPVKHGEPQNGGHSGANTGVVPGRVSPSAQASQVAELARIRAMTPLQRMELALALGRRRLAMMAMRAQGGHTP